ncbi:heterokaryon incompatibility protein-domain-containing protein [Scleroderma yunnanense]
MLLINVKAFLEREFAMSKGWKVDRRTKVIELRDDEVTTYVILSHRWLDQEVNYEEMVELAKMEGEERDEIRQRDGYRKILGSCEQAKRDGYEWLWVDTCCIDKRSSAELSEAINSMYRWYENSTVCYAYLHDLLGSSFPTASNKRTYPNSNGWPEWFSRGWTLQEMIAPSDVQFFNKDWQRIGDKRRLARALTDITRVPQHILTDGLSSNRPCVAQIISWAANRTTTRVEDRAYSLLGLLDVHMPMLYGEGKKAFHRLQLEIIRTSNDQSVFAWGQNERDGSILADDPSFFGVCYDMVLMDHNEFIEYLEGYIPGKELPTIEEDRFGVFPITNRGIQIWLLLRPLKGSRSVFEAWLPCYYGGTGGPVRINLALRESNYYRYFTLGGFATEGTLQFRQLYLRYQDLPHHNVTFEIDDSAITRNGFVYCGEYPGELMGDTLTLTNTDPLCVKVYCDSQADCHFAVGFGRCFGKDWIQFIYEKHASRRPWEDYAEEAYEEMLVKGPEYAQSMAAVRSRGECYGRVWVKHNHLPGSTRTVRTSYIVWESSRKCGVRIDAFPYPGFGNVSGEWTSVDVERTSDPSTDIQGLMICDNLRKLQDRYTVRVDGVTMVFSLAPNGIKLGDYGHFTDSSGFCCEGNIFSDLKSLVLELEITPRQHEISGRQLNDTDSDYVMAHHCISGDVPLTLYKPLGLSVPNNCHVNSLLASLSAHLTNGHLVTRVIQCVSEHSGERPRELDHPTGPHKYPRLDTNKCSIITCLCTIAQPFVWLQDRGTDPVSG